MADFDKNRFASKKQDWETPDELFNPLHKEFNFTLDLAGDKINSKIPNVITKEENAFDIDWKGICWLNPPYGSKGYKLKDWVIRAYEQSMKHKSTIVMLIPARTNNQWWHEYCMKGEVRFIKGRPKFKGCVHGLPQPLAIVIFNGEYSGIMKTQECVQVCL